MEALLFSKTDIYHGNYVFTKRDASHEFTKALHYHDFYEMQFYVCESADGKIGDITINGVKHELRQGSLILINMFDVHQINITCREPYIRYCVSFDSSLLLFACSAESNLFNIFSHCTDSKYYKPLTPQQIATFAALYSKHEKLRLHNGNDILGKAIILEIFAYVYDIFYDGQSISDADSKGLATITELINYIEDHLSENLSLEMLAEHAAYSTFHLSRIFKRYTNNTLNKYIVNKRIDRAKILIKTTDTSITEISRNVGFNNYNHFYRTFKAITGINPVDYRASFSEGL